MKMAATIGFKPDEFWLMTPSELIVCAEAHQENEKEQLKENITVAWLNAHWQRLKQMPELDEVFARLEPKKEMTDEEIFEQIKAWTIALGGEIIDDSGKYSCQDRG